MASPKIIFYHPNPTPRSRPIDAEEWERHQARLQELYMKDGKELEEVMEIMASCESFHASRRQYTKKFNEWGWCKKFPARVMKTALRKHAQAGKDHSRFKYRDTAITPRHMDRWQQRMPRFDPLSSPTASTPSQMNIDSPPETWEYSTNKAIDFTSPVSEHRANASHGPDTPLEPVDPSYQPEPDDDNDDFINIAYNEIRRSVSPQVAEYIFHPRGDIISCPASPATIGWTASKFKFMMDQDLAQLTEDNVRSLRQLVHDLWTFNTENNLGYCAHIWEVLIARERLAKLQNSELLQKMRMNLLVTYMVTYMTTSTTSEYEQYLNEFIAELDVPPEDNPLSAGYHLLSAAMHLHQGRHRLAKDLCTQTIVSLRSTVGLSHHMTWEAYQVFATIVGHQTSSDGEYNPITDFYRDVHETLSPHLLPGLRALFQLCGTYIGMWMPEAQLQTLVRNRYLTDSPPDVDNMLALILDTVLQERCNEAQGTLPRAVRDMRDAMGLGITKILSCSALLIFRRSRTLRSLEPITIQQKALSVVADLKSDPFLVPLWIYNYSKRSLSSEHESPDECKNTEQGFLASLKAAVNTGVQGGDEFNFYPSTGARRLKSVSAIDKSRAFLGSFSANDPEHYNGSITASPILCLDDSTSLNRDVLSHLHRPVPEPEAPTPFSVLLQNKEPSSPWAGSSASPGQLLRDVRIVNRLSPTMMDAPTPPFTFVVPQTPRSSYMLPPSRLGPGSPATAPSFVLRGHPDSAATLNLFDLPQSPLPPSPFSTSDQPPTS